MKAKQEDKEKFKDKLKIAMLENELQDIKTFFEEKNPLLFVRWKKQWNNKI